MSCFVAEYLVCAGVGGGRGVYIPCCASKCLNNIVNNQLSSGGTGLGGGWVEGLLVYRLPITVV